MPIPRAAREHARAFVARREQRFSIESDAVLSARRLRRLRHAVDTRTFCASPIVRAAITTDGLVLLDVRGGVVLAANDVGARIWQLLEQHQTPHAIAERFAGEYEIALEQARGDVTDFIDALVSRRLILEKTP